MRIKGFWFWYREQCKTCFHLRTWCSIPMLRAVTYHDIAKLSDLGSRYGDSATAVVDFGPVAIKDCLVDAKAFHGFLVFLASQVSDEVDGVGRRGDGDNTGWEPKQADPCVNNPVIPSRTHCRVVECPAG